MLNRLFTRRPLLIFAGLVLLLSGMSMVLPQRAAAADFNYQTKVDYIVSKSGYTHVAQHYRVTNNTSRTILKAVQLSTPTDQISNLNVSYNDGAAIPYSQAKKQGSISGYTYGYIEITINFDRTNVGKNVGWGFDVSYDTTKLVDTKGSARTVFIPAVGASDVTQDYSARLLVPDDFGKIHTTTATPVYDGIQNGQAVYEFNKQDLSKQSIVVVFGDSTIYHLNFNFPLHNTSDKEQTMTVTLPPDTPSQKVYINKLDPKPQKIHLDADGNVLADYKVAAGQRLTVKTDVDGVVKYLDYDLNKAGTKKGIPSNLVKRYTSSTHYWQSNNTEIITKGAQAASGAGDNVAKITKALNKFVVDTLSYNNAKIQYNVRQGALKALDNPTNAVCLEYSDLLIALLRSQGIPARMPVGYAYSGNLKKSAAVDDSLHSWVEVYMPGVGWVNVDPTWNEKFEGFGRSDLDHFAFAIWGAQDNEPTAVMDHGSDENYQYERTTLNFLKTAQTSTNLGSLEVKQYVLIPFVSVVHYSASAPSNVSGDNYQIELSNSKVSRRENLGSLAAGQTVGGWVPVVSAGFASALVGRFIQQQEGIPVLATANAVVNWIGLWVLIVLLSGVVLIFVIRSAKKRRHQAPSSAKRL